METCKVILEKIKDENVKVCTNGEHKIFLKSDKDFLIARGIFKMLCDKVYNEFWELVKEYNKIHVMEENMDCTIISLTENLNSSYYIPMLYDDGEITGKISYTEKLAQKNDIEYTNGRIMHSSFIKNKDEEEFLPLFNSVQTLRRIFNEEEYNVLAIDFDDILSFCDDKDVVVVPTVCDLVIPQKMLKNVKSIEYLYSNEIYGQIRRMNDLDFGSEEGFMAYTNVLRLLNEFEHLFVITREVIRPEFEGMPQVRTLDRGNVLNVFTDFGLAVKWCKNYKMDIDGIMPIGLLEKNNGYLSLFQTAAHFGIGIMLNEGIPFVIFNPKDFIDVNKLKTDIDIVFRPDELEKIMSGGLPKIDFNKYKIALPEK